MNKAALFCFLVLGISFVLSRPLQFTAKLLPFRENGLEPFLGEITVFTHFHKHHVGYVNKLNAQVSNIPELASMSLEDIIVSKELPQNVVNLAAQIYNHDLYWQCLQSGNDETVNENVINVLNRDFGGFDKFQEEFSQRAAKHFGSGWVWLSFDSKKGSFVITEGHDAGNPLQEGLKPVLTIDVWEHAYYLDYKNDRARYIDQWWQYVNWKQVSQNIKDVETNHDKIDL